MTRKQRLGLWLWAGSLALVLVAIVPMAMGWRVIAALACVAFVALQCRRALRIDQHLSERMLRRAAALPPVTYRYPVLLVCGDGLSGLFGPVADEQLALRVTAHGCYLPVAGAEQLTTVAAELLAARPQWAAQLGVLLVVDAASHSDSAVLVNQVRSFGYQVAKIRKRGLALPLMVMSYLPEAAAAGAWFSWEAGCASPNVREGGACMSLADWQRSGSDVSLQPARLQACVQLDSVAQWLAEWVVPALTETIPGHAPARPPVTLAIASTPALDTPVANNLWQRWLCERVGVAASDTMQRAPDVQPRFPDELLHLLPGHAPNRDRFKAHVLGVWLFVFAGIAALMSSAWQNTLLMRQVSDDLRRYQAIGPAMEPHDLAQRQAAVAVLHQHAQRLDRYYRHGEPWALGLGLYQGGSLRAPLLAAIASHRQPAALPRPADKPGSVRLDSLSLFGTGSARLRPDATQVLIKALFGIQAQPGWLIVIAGHTDATGSDEHNLRLSRARAAAVHAWMLRMSDIPASCFAVQGLGASQPVASNDTESGRAANRRVEIRLVPEPGACASGHAVSGLQPLPHSAAFND
ncbi:flagellar motor protein MotB [Pseudomonas sp. 10-1B]|uniref:OmpA family protein n=1 Tax=Pseudomonas sp. 10-1B TaxID=1546029 RepID=UPI00061E53B0|nr:OmpA family protein [Pseudomonas sp. 10-1B]KIY40787.1 flagellar motor protein MotB [Pseudomonas sp. 10-1B]